MTNEKSIDVLNDLIETSRDGVEGFRKCAEDSHDPTLRMYFEDRSKSCDEAIRSLSEEVRKLGGEPATGGSTTGALHRMWIDFRTAITNKDNLAVLEECERAEDIALEAYEDALKEELSDNLRSLITQQLDGVRRNHDRVHQLRDEAEANPS
ncbi:PA2169 family four-helix-bundle protein [Nitrosomonas sp. JL21]|uniref:ferritin-like domain-containing protein n=1 Tax=Nitrosomonas sp. JL21 TaxID=153949 RepID=UPI00136C59DF|nr:PA2169 family four-helix-bundle protein [Nitrosomonas sp. JL21]MBL8496390.1 PA2169 family four-helix-bundle protein [Nitrosomonas sp.]MXS77338.1 PA2169 family four-helix-bundle protein [Nitrosomonas sp. JL21]